MLKIDIHKKIKSVKEGNMLSVSAEFEQGSITGIYGNSGEGKTTLLNSITGLITPEKGVITFKNKEWFNAKTKTNVLTQHRNIGYLFQEDSLFPHFTVKENILYPLSKEHRKTIDLEEVLGQVEMNGFEESYPRNLSGGQKQRVAIARSLVQKTQLLLLDEPFSSLDLEIKQKLYKLIRSFKDELNLTILLVTHDVNDIYALCDKVLWLQNHSSDSLMSKKEFKIKIENILS